MNTTKEILIVEDESGYRNLIERRLRIAGYYTVSAQNGEEALVALWERPYINLVLLDVRLPVLNGLNIFEIIRKDFPDKRIIVSSVLQKDEQQFLIYDADEYYDKSEDLSILIEKVDRVLSHSMGRLRENEKRTFRRVPVNVLANFESTSQDSYGTHHFLGYTKDLSACGGRFMVGESVEFGQHLTISLELPINFLPLLIDGQVIWIRNLNGCEVQSKGGVEIGVKFVKIASPHDEEKLKSYLSYA